MRFGFWRVSVVVSTLALTAIGCAGDDGSVGPPGPEGPQGIQGIQGEQGIQGIQGAPGLAGHIKRTTFGFTHLPASSTNPTQLASLTFTPPASGTAYLRVRGYCNLTGAATPNALNIAAGTALDTLFTAPNFSNVVAVSVPGGVTGLYQIPFLSEHTLAVTGGSATTVVAGVRRETAVAHPANCTGSFAVELYQPLP